MGPHRLRIDKVVRCYELHDLYLLTQETNYFTDYDLFRYHSAYYYNKSVIHSHYSLHKKEAVNVCSNVATGGVE